MVIQRKPLRVGIIDISQQLIHNERLWPQIQAIMAHLVVLKAEPDYWLDIIRYTAFSREFDEVAEGSIPPHYHAVITMNDTGAAVHVGFERVGS